MYQPISVKGAMRAMCHATNTDFATVAVLSPERKRRCVERLVNMKPMALRTPREAKKRSAVLVPLVDVRGQTCLLYTKRANNISHGGQVSFPGGNQDKNDATLRETALRETWEELGIPSESIDLWADMAPLSSRNEGEYATTPVVGVVNNFSLSSLHVNTAEVSEVFTVPLSQLCNPRLHGYTQFRVADKPGYSLPVYTGPPHVIWGLTAIMTFQLLRHLLPARLYRHQLRYQSPIQLRPAS